MLTIKAYQLYYFLFTTQSLSNNNSFNYSKKELNFQLQNIKQYWLKLLLHHRNQLHG